jgi:hypothetical protein
MDRDCRATFCGALTALILLAAFLGAYLAGYFWLGMKWHWVDAHGGPSIIEREYPHPILATMYWPMGRIEGRLCDIDVQITFADDPLYEVP